MDLLDSVKQMQQQGMSDGEIVQNLKEQGFSPKDIDNTLGQSKIKAAIYEQSGQDAIMNNSQGEMQQSIMTQEIPQQGVPVPEQAQYPQYAQQEYSYYQPQQAGVSPETITDIAEQIVSEKISEIKKSIGNISEFKAIMDSRVSNIDERLKKIEKTIDNLQAAILNKVSSNLDSIQDIKSEMETMQESFSKVINPLVDKTRASQEGAEKEETRQEKQKSKKQKPGFEDFLR